MEKCSGHCRDTGHIEDWDVSYGNEGLGCSQEEECLPANVHISAA